MNIQQQWLNKTIGAWYALDDTRPSLVEYLASIWLSSPQGLAAKQMLEAAKAVLPHLQAVAAHDERERLLASLHAARKAGLT